MSRLKGGHSPPDPKKLCKRCIGAGHLLRPLPRKLLNFKKCTDCAGYGVRWSASKTRK